LEDRPPAGILAMTLRTSHSEMCIWPFLQLGGHYPRFQVMETNPLKPLAMATVRASLWRSLGGFLGEIVHQQLVHPERMEVSFKLIKWATQALFKHFKRFCR
jgi:hypothetical protein